jgi:exonuclease SbcC
MIPLKMELRNFLSYGDSLATVNFKNHSLICLSGKNGNGKSALLDAMTWALWGQARKVSGSVKADAGLLRLGQTRMMVSLEFLCGEQRYRVRREFAKTYGKPITALHFDLFDLKKKFFISLEEKTIRQTQAKIEKIIGIDFDTFINSAFLRQGHSNEFSKKTPKERKQILANIIGLSRYDELSKLALEYSRKYNNEQKVLMKIGEKATQELELEPALEKKFNEKKKTLATTEKEVVDIEKKIEKFEKEKLQFLKIKYENDQLEKTAHEKKDELKKLVVSWRMIHVKSLFLPNLKTLDLEHKKILQQERFFREKQQQEISLQEKIIAQKNKCQDRLLQCQQKYDAELQAEVISCEKAELAQKQLLEQEKVKNKKYKELQKKRDEAVTKIKNIEKELCGYEEFKKECDRAKAQFEKRRVFYQTLVQRGNVAQKDLFELERKKILVQDKKNPSCPLCEQVLTLKRKQFLSKTFVIQASFLQYRIARVKKILKNLKLMLFEQHKTVQKITLQDERFKQLIANRELLVKSETELKVELERESIEINLLKMRIKKGEGELAKLRQKCDEKTKKRDAAVESDKRIKALKVVLGALEKERSAIGYDKKGHEKLQKELHNIEKQLADLESIKNELLRQPERRENITKLCSDIKKINKRRIGLCNKTDTQNPKNKINMLKKERGVFFKTKEILLQELGKLENKKQRFSDLKKENKIRAGEMKKLNEQAREYQALSQMFGRDGIQALLIEEVIPEIEQEANRLLSKLTDNKSQIFIESLRDLKKGGVKESLDIHISDASGIRPYEMFSGGEAFRIDFSLRIAISKLLARRAGTALQTLIIDEGFGSQDEEGLQRLMDAIHAIQKDFSRIIVVSHLNALKDSFPVHFIIKKGALGSFVQVEERG